jgi:uncharacterized oxidoreductase
MTRVDKEELHSFLTSVLTELKVPTETAADVVDSLTLADIKGHHSHGVARVPYYEEMMADGAIDSEGEITLPLDEGALGIVDGGSNFGQVVGRRAVELGVKKAAQEGVAVINVRNASHLGRIGEWAERATDADMLFAAFVNTGSGGGLVAPPGSTQRRLATNPVSFGVPSFDVLEFPIVLDMATSQVAGGKIRERLKRDEPLPEGWAVDDDGNPLTDPGKFFSYYSDTDEDGTGAILPVGGTTSGYKGFGLAVIAELFAGIVGNGYVQGQRTIDWFSNQAAFFFVDPTRFASREELSLKIKQLVSHLRTTPFDSKIAIGEAARGDHYLLPGEPEHNYATEQREDGIFLPEPTKRALRQAATEHGLDESIPDGM